MASDASEHVSEPANFLHTTFHQFMSWKLNEITTSSPSPPPSVTASDPRAAPSPPSCSSQLLNFKRGIKRDIFAYATLKDENESFKRPTMGYDNYLTLLQNACIRYDSNLKSRPSPASRAAYQHDMSPSYPDNPYSQDYSSSGTTYGGIDMPAEEFYQVHTTNLNRPPNVSTLTPRKPLNAPPPGRPNPRRSPGPIYLPANIYKLLHDKGIKELKKHNVTTRSTPPPKRAVNTHDTDHHPAQPSTDTPTGDPTPWTKSMNIRSFKTMGKPSIIPSRERYPMPQMGTRKSGFT